jgi:hypothetical protein
LAPFFEIAEQARRDRTQKRPVTQRPPGWRTITIPRLLTQASISKALDFSPVMASSTAKEHASCLLGFKAEAEVSSSRSTVTLLYGLVFSFEYHFTGGEINEKHSRTTAFKDL